MFFSHIRVSRLMAFQQISVIVSTFFKFKDSDKTLRSLFKSTESFSTRKHMQRAINFYPYIPYVSLAFLLNPAELARPMTDWPGSSLQVCSFHINFNILTVIRASRNLINVKIGLYCLVWKWRTTCLPNEHSPLDKGRSDVSGCTHFIWYFTF